MYPTSFLSHKANHISVRKSHDSKLSLIARRGEANTRNTPMTLCAKTTGAGWHLRSFGTYGILKGGAQPLLSLGTEVMLDTSFGLTCPDSTVASSTFQTRPAYLWEVAHYRILPRHCATDGNSHETPTGIIAKMGEDRRNRTYRVLVNVPSREVFPQHASRERA
jgi:hypothetical protein